jgi:23S rRNA (uracil1939-C5)-methyltransferase
MFQIQTLRIDKLGQRGEGIAHDGAGPVFVPYGLPGDLLRAEVDGERGQIVEIVEPGPGRIEPFCEYFGDCGGCAVQALAPQPYAEWKRDLVVSALMHAKVDAQVLPLVDAHGEGRRRATFHARIRHDGLNRQTIDLGFMRARAHDIVNIDQCPILAPGLSSAPAVARRLAQTLAQTGKPLDILITTTMSGLDVDVRGVGKLDGRLRQQLVVLAGELDLARLSNHGETLVEIRPPMLQMGRAALSPPPGAFLQATEKGEQTLADLVLAAVDGKAQVADLFAGVGTFTLRLAERSKVLAVESDAGMMGALARAAHRATGLKQVTTQTRDLVRRPLSPVELKDFDAVVFDPPRAGADIQARAFAATHVPLIVAVSCNAQTFARDARILIEGGYVIGDVIPVDQFRHSPHVEMVATFRKQPLQRAKRKGRLLG